ncbi:hypothetical protein JG688_00017393 [Phytophthora aleatoria]|uniref:Uncharacterized protein n=1 Tax=Phytophthora aleatoria TaxID=2496075 RepID=A0A8J5IAK3_9STRA|nr:hypothetical protein JG688_00017393 [Phytophthora aleatoria]
MTLPLVDQPQRGSCSASCSSAETRYDSDSEGTALNRPASATTARRWKMGHTPSALSI